jgi:trk system potassium uptake protein TrkA
VYIIIVGLGGIGRNLARIAVSEKHNVVVIDKDPERTREIALRYDLISLTGDASLMSMLEEANISEADCVICVTGDDNINLMVALKAQEKGVKKITTIVNEFENIEIFKKTGVMIHKNPDAVVAENIYNSLWRPAINDFVSMAGGKAEIIEVIIPEGSSLSGKAIKDLGLPPKTLVIAIERGENVIIPEGSTVIMQNDSLFVFAERTAVDIISDLLK